MHYRSPSIGRFYYHFLICASPLLSHSLGLSFRSRVDFSDRTNSKYYMIIVQYTARLHNDRIRQAICALSDNPPPRKAFNFRLCPPEINDKLTGYTHNAVAPIGCTEKLPVIISDRIAKLDPPFIWLVRNITSRIFLFSSSILSVYLPGFHLIWFTTLF